MRAAGQARVRREVRRRTEGDGLASGGMSERDLLRMEKYPRRRRAAVERVAQNREAVCRRVDANLVRPARERLGGDFPHSAFRIPNSTFEPRLRRVSASIGRQAGVTLAIARYVAAHHEFAGRRRTIGDEQVALAHLALLELLGERFVRQWSFAEDEDAAGVFVEAMEDGEARPARFAVAEPVVNALACERRGGVRVPAGGFVHHQQVFVFKEDAGESRGKGRDEE